MFCNFFVHHIIQVSGHSIILIKKILQLKLFRKIANVKDDGTVQLEVPGDIKPFSIMLKMFMMDVMMRNLVTQLSLLIYLPCK